MVHGMGRVGLWTTGPGRLRVAQAAYTSCVPVHMRHACVMPAHPAACRLNVFLHHSVLAGKWLETRIVPRMNGHSGLFRVQQSSDFMFSQPVQGKSGLLTLSLSLPCFNFGCAVCSELLLRALLVVLKRAVSLQHQVSCSVQWAACKSRSWRARGSCCCFTSWGSSPPQGAS